MTLSESCSSDDAARFYQYLMDTHPTQTFWRATCLEHHRASREGLSALGFAEVRRTWTPQMPLSAFPDDWLLGEFQQAQQLGYAVSEEAVRGEAFKAELARAHLDAYRATHQVNPSAELGLKEWQDIFLDDLQSIFTARYNGRLAAFASVRGGGEVYWFGTLPEFAADASVLTAALKRAEVKYGRLNGLDTLNFELDSTDPAALDILSRLPTAGGEALLTYHRGGNFTVPSMYSPSA